MAARRKTKRIVVGVLLAGVLVGSTPFEVNAAPNGVSRVAASFPSSLSVGARGDNVAALQRALMTAGIPVHGGADGIFGPATQASVRNYQTREGLPVTGIADQHTLITLGLVSAPTTVDDGAETTVGASRGASGTPVAPTITLQHGSRGPEVARLQQALIDAGIPVHGGADGIFGNATRSAVRTFQTQRHLPVTGVAEGTTLGALGLTGVSTTPGTGTPGTGTPVTGTPVTGTPVTGTPVLQIGARGEDVARLQRALIAAGIHVQGGADGVFGLVTQAAIRNYQSRQGILVTGVADAATWAALSAAPTPPATTPPPSGGTVVKIGDRGDSVREVQNALMKAGIHVQGGADGVFGVATQTAVRSFQAARGLPATGEVDAATRASLGIGGAATPPPSTVLLKVGDRGPDVTRVQQALMDRGVHVRGGADGVYGLATSTAVREFQTNRGLTQTGNVDEATWDALGLNETPGSTTPPPTIAVFPMQGPCYFGDTWGAPRSGGRRHEGVDIIGATGRLIYAAADGTITRKYIDTPGSRTGNGVRLTVPGGTYYFYAHFSAFAEGIDIGTEVVAGQIIGYNGATGNATVPHLHFEVHPGGGAAINPYPVVKAIDACKTSTPLPQPELPAPPV